LGVIGDGLKKNSDIESRSHPALFHPGKQCDENVIYRIAMLLETWFCGKIGMRKRNSDTKRINNTEHVHGGQKAEKQKKCFENRNKSKITTEIEEGWRGSHGEAMQSRVERWGSIALRVCVYVIQSGVPREDECRRDGGG